MTGKTNDTVTKIKKNVAKNCKNFHCITHGYALVTQKMSLSLKKVLDEAVQIVKFIISRSLQICILKQFCEFMGNEYKPCCCIQGLDGS